MSVIRIVTDGNIVQPARADTNRNMMVSLTELADNTQVLRAFGGMVIENVSNYDLVAGTNNLYSATVPAGEVWMINDAAIMIASTSISRLRLYISDGTNNVPINDVSSPTSGKWYIVFPNVYLTEGYYIWLVVSNATAGDDAHLWYCGYKFTAP